MMNFIKNSMLPIATAVPNSPVMKKAITAVVSVAVTRHVRAFDMLLALESTSLIESIQRLIMVLQTFLMTGLVIASDISTGAGGDLSRLRLVNEIYFR
jgi:3-hydroxy-3-methylglutaryl CoA synthase